MELFAKLLYVDTFRGEHSTGVFSLFKPYGQPITTRVTKAAVAGPFFIADNRLWDEATSLSYLSGYNRVEAKTFPKVVFGHNRYATRGKVNDENAHPFIHDHITLAHNGTLRDQSLLPDHEQFEVDSNNICYSIAKIGADETIQKLKGAFTLIWHDANLNTLNIIRNSERPFHLAELPSGDWFGASEEWMLMGILGRGKTPKTVKRHFETEVGVQYIFDVSDGCKLVEEKKHTLPVFPSYTQGTSRRSSYYEELWGDYYQNEYASSRSTPKNDQKSTKALPPPSKANTATNALMQKYGTSIQIGDIIQYEMLTNHPYTGPLHKNRGCIKGWLPQETDFIEVHEHQAFPEEFESDRSRYCVITSCFEMNCLLTLIARPLTEEEKLRLAGPAEEEKPVIDLSDFFEEDDDAEEQEVCASGEVFTRTEWNNSHYSKCANCTVDIAFEDVPDSHILDNADACLCSACYKELVLEIEQEEETEEVSSFQCTGCKSDYLSDQESAKGSLCKACFEKFPARKDSDKVVIGNGWTVTGALWSKMNTCIKCKDKIPYSVADIVKFHNGNPLCLICSRRKVVKK